MDYVQPSCLADLVRDHMLQVHVLFLVLEVIVQFTGLRRFGGGFSIERFPKRRHMSQYMEWIRSFVRFQVRIQSIVLTLQVVQNLAPPFRVEEERFVNPVGFLIHKYFLFHHQG